tara:strand:- start:125 stop:472 length:348 start_codon:yes stop_codon:yes gene_type:complete
MGYYNVPDDWGQYYYACGCHASEGGCSCPEGLLENADRPWLSDAGYEIDEDGNWSKLISYTVHTCRRDHKGGRIKKGDRYKLRVYRNINDEDGCSWIYKRKTIIKKANQNGGGIG